MPSGKVPVPVSEAEPVLPNGLPDNTGAVQLPVAPAEPAGPPSLELEQALRALRASPSEANTRSRECCMSEGLFMPFGRSEPDEYSLVTERKEPLRELARSMAV
jgi:hypothetical protein